MTAKCIKSFVVAVSSLFITLLSNMAIAQHDGGHGAEITEKGTTAEPEEKIDAARLIMEHVMDNHEFHFAEFGGHPVSVPLPIILYSPQRGFDAFMSSNFGHGHAAYRGYKMVNDKVVAVNTSGQADESIKVYDFSLTRNVVQMFLAVILLLLVMLNIAGKYRENGTKKAPSGFQNAIEPVITFVRDEVGKPNLGRKYEKYMPYLLTVFFFILINNLVGLIPGTANVTGNISFTLVLAFISMIVILFSTNGHFWGHIFWPPGVPFFVKVILIPVEFAGVFIKPIALMIRLFANMIAGHIVIICFISLIFIFGAMSKAVGVVFTPVSLAFTIFIYFIEILVAFIQAFIFTNLTAVFIGQAFETGHVDHNEHPHDPHPTQDRKEKEFAL
ncbi:MAG: ATP synthase F0 sector subunit a [uncultured Segetibacter sp.]|uniref:ATP synthase subunit a n=1 Tax=uncultured Segetibacter sp. TaxID=481133 RepID=A0A6J4RSY2_9BACT|nr:MAG: ATP synthase F0 sector subunit a [uncultured Segetibacter sp.]